MKRINQIFLTIILSGSAFTACEMKKEIMDDRDSSLTGEWILGVDAEDEATAFQTISRASSTIDVSTFQVVITDANDAVVKKYDQFKQLKEEGTLILKQGAYRVASASGEMKEAAFNTPVYAAKESFVIESRKITRTDLLCSLQNVKVTVECSENFKKTFKPDYRVVISNGKKGILTFGKDTVGAGYFAPCDFLKMTVMATTLENERFVTQTFNLNEQKANGLAEAKDYFRVVLDIKELVGAAGAPVISADLTLNERDEVITVPSEETPTDPEPAAGPVLTTTGFTFGTPILFSAADEVKPTVIVDIDAVTGGGIENLIVNITSDYLNALLPFEVPIDLAHMSETDAAIIGELGLPTDVLGKTQVRFDITTFMGPLALGVGTTTFTISVTDKAGNTSTGNIITTVTE